MNTPETAVREFFKTFNQGDIEACLAFYEPKAAFVAQPGQVAEGTAALRVAINVSLTLKPTLSMGRYQAIVAGDIALSIAKWTLKGTGPDGKPIQMEGTTTDVLRRQADGRWLFVIDNPWGVGILG
jgi:ketosteroid isomerase-like protein